MSIIENLEQDGLEQGNLEQSMTEDEWILFHFNRLEHHIQRALDNTLGEYAPNDVLEKLYKRQAQIWPMEDSVMITAIDTFPTGLVTLRIWLSGGNKKELLTLEQNVTEWAKEQGCTKLTIFGRRGWLKVLEISARKNNTLF